MGIFTDFLNLFKPGDDGVLDITKIDENSDKIDEWAEKVGDPEGLEGDSKNIVTEVNANRNAIENNGEQIENLSWVKLHDGTTDITITLSENVNNFEQVCIITTFSWSNNKPISTVIPTEIFMLYGVVIQAGSDGSTTPRAEVNPGGGGASMTRSSQAVKFFGVYGVNRKN